MLTLGAEPLAPLVAPALPLAGALMRGPVARVADAVVSRLPEGPSEEARRRARWIVVAVAHAGDGRRRRVAVRGTDVYGTTAASAAHAAGLLATAGLGARSRRRRRSTRTPSSPTWERSARPPEYHPGMEGFGFFQDPDFQKRLQEMAEQMQATQSLAWADNAIKLAVDMTVAAINRVNVQGTTEQQAQQIRTVMATVFPEAVTLVREARQGLS